MPQLTLSAESARIQGLSFVTVYVDDFPKAREFYEDVLGLKRTFEGGTQAGFFAVGGNEFGLYVEGGANAKRTKPDDCHTGVVFMVESAAAIEQRLRLNGVRIVQDEPVDRGEGDFWFQFYDPAGNLLEILGGR